MRRPAHRAPPWLAAAAMSMAVFAVAARADDTPLAPAAAPLSDDGAQIFGRICQGCHMPDARGATGAGRYPNLAGNPKLASWQFVASTVLNGRNAMPPFGLPGDHYSGFLKFVKVQLTDAQVADVVNSVRSSFGNHFKGKISAAQVAGLVHPGAATH